MVRFLAAGLVGIVCMGASTCGIAPIGGAEYGLTRGAPNPGMAISQRGTAFIVDQGLGDRAFTSLHSVYNASWQLIAAGMRASCCGMWWRATLRRNSDGSYSFWREIFGATAGNAPDIRLDRLTLPKDRPIVLGNLLLLPWLYHLTHLSTFTSIVLTGLANNFGDVLEVGITTTSPLPFPEDVPHGDKALQITEKPYKPETMWTIRAILSSMHTAFRATMQ